MNNHDYTLLIINIIKLTSTSRRAPDDRQIFNQYARFRAFFPSC
jgi:hypothetical protein